MVLGGNIAGRELHQRSFVDVGGGCRPIPRHLNQSLQQKTRRFSRALLLYGTSHLHRVVGQLLGDQQFDQHRLGGHESRRQFDRTQKTLLRLGRLARC